MRTHLLKNALESRYTILDEYQRCLEPESADGYGLAGQTHRTVEAFADSYFNASPPKQ